MVEENNGAGDEPPPPDQNGSASSSGGGPTGSDGAGRQVRSRKHSDKSQRASGGGERSRSSSKGPRTLSLANDAIWAALRSPMRFRLFESIRACPEVEVSALARAFGSTPQRLYYHLDILVKAGLAVEVHGAPGAKSRGPAPVRYKPAFIEEPDGFFDGDEKAAARASELLHAIALEGVKLSTNGSMLDGAISDFCSETLTPDELTEIGRRIDEIQDILTEARNRRYRSGSAVKANAFVGLCLVPVSGPSLPSGPIGRRKR
ncbi:MAG: winged helix-turn-helix domain-containing protein [Phycisphaerales bacterium]